jgi:phage shock protein E
MRKEQIMKNLGKFGLIAIAALFISNTLFGSRGDDEDAIRTHLKNNALVIDVRTAGEFQSWNFEDSINIPYDVIASQIVNHEKDQGRPIVVYCRSGNRSSYAKRYLFDVGYTNVLDAGGLSSIRKYLDE